MSINELTSREIQVAGQVALGLSNEEIAHNLGTTLSTVKNHCYRINKKLGLTNRVQIALWSISGKSSGHKKSLIASMMATGADFPEISLSTGGSDTEVEKVIDEILSESGCVSPHGFKIWYAKNRGYFDE